MHKKKMIAPIIITIILLLYYLGFACLCFFIEGMPVWCKLVMGIVPLILAAVCIFVLAERIKEIRSGEEDDLGKY